MMRSVTAVVIAVTLLLAASVPGHARSMSYAIDKLILPADSVVVATAMESRPRWGEGAKMIWTDWTFHLREQWWGHPQAGSFTVSVAGGALDGEARSVSGTPTFERGATYVLFLHDNTHHFHSPVVGEWQGMFRQWREVATGQLILVGDDGRRLEKLESGELVRGAYMESLGKEDLVRVAPPAPASPRQIRIVPEVRGPNGELIPQDERSFAPKKPRESGRPADYGALRETVLRTVRAAREDR